MPFEVIDPDTHVVIDILPMTTGCNTSELGELCGGCDECLYR